MPIYQTAHYRVKAEAVDKVKAAIVEAAAAAHGSSAEVRRFEDVYTPELTEGPVVFTNYGVVATNRP